MRKKNKRGKGGIGGPMNVHNQKQEAVIDWSAKALVIASQLLQTDAEFRALSGAKRAGNSAEIGRLLTILKERYGAGPHLLRVYRCL